MARIVDVAEAEFEAVIVFSRELIYAKPKLDGSFPIEYDSRELYFSSFPTDDDVMAQIPEGWEFHSKNIYPVVELFDDEKDLDYDDDWDDEGFILEEC